MSRPWAGWLMLGVSGGLFVALLVAYNVDTLGAWSRAQALEARGERVEARVLSASTAGVRGVHDTVRYRFVVPHAGAEAAIFEATVTASLGAARGLRPGGTVTVRYLPEDPSVSRLEGDPGEAIDLVMLALVDGLVLAALLGLGWLVGRSRRSRRSRG